MAAVRAAAIGIERPLERHPFDLVQRGPAPDLLILRRVGAANGLGQRIRASGFYEVGNLPDGRLRFSKIKEEGSSFHEDRW